MISVDTNVLVRVLTNDDPVQARRALARFHADVVWISKTVLLETEWVLRYAYRLDAAKIEAALGTLLSVSNVDVEDRATVTKALAWYAGGLDFADALHLAASSAADEFVSFDRALARRARVVGASPRVAQP